ncbi:MAG TPA: hypothetical protein VH084_28535 [Mycobacterium sp.]|jgi:hypothetical protein|nr:hypothetical protein [Mycobacterium sp.]
MTYPLPSWTDDPTTSDPIDAENLDLYNTAIDGLDTRTSTIEASGAVNALATAKGDMIAAHAVNDMETLGVGTDGQVLTADASATLGVGWADPAPGGVSSVTAGDTSIHVDNTDPINPTVIVNQANLTVAESQVTSLTTHLAAKQPLDSDLTTIAGLTPGSGNVMAADGSGWISKTYAALKTALGLTKSDVGLGSVDNTADTAKPVSTAQQTALNLKQDLSAKAAASGYASLDGSTKVPIAQLPTGTSSTTVTIGNDSRLSDSRTPTGSATGSLTGTYPNPAIAAGAVGASAIASALIDPAAGTAGLRTLGTGSTQACEGDDARLSDNRDPNAHAATHALLSGDTLFPSAIGAVDTATVTAVGDLYVATGVGTVDRFGVGADAQVLVADSTQTSGLSWVPVPAPDWAGQIETLADGTTISPDCVNGAIKGGSCDSLSSSTTLNAPANGAICAVYRAQITAIGGSWTITLSGWLGTTDNATTAVVIPTGKTASFIGEFCSNGWLYGGYTIQS